MLNNYISAKSTIQILSLNVEYTFLFSNFLIIGLCYSLASCSFSGISFAPLPEDFLSKNL